MKAILISINPKWVEKILNGEKTIEIRKTLPKCDLPIDVYVYCGKAKTTFEKTLVRYRDEKVVAKFTLNKVNAFFSYDETFLEDSCLTSDELEDYADNKNILYAWHIDNLVIFDKPKELKEFYVYSHSVVGVGLDGKDKTFEILKSLTKAPQSYCFIRDVL